MPRARKAAAAKRQRAIVPCVWHVIGARLCGRHLVRKVGPRNLFVEPGPCVDRPSAIRLNRQRLKGRKGLSRKSVAGRFYATEQAAIFAALAASASSVQAPPLEAVKEKPGE